MAVMGQVLQQRLARSIEAKLRHELSVGDAIAGWGSGTIAFLARWIYDQRIPGSPYTYLQYYNLARNTVRNARDAATMQANPEMTILDLQKAPGQPATFPRYEYRTVVVGRDVHGNETWSTLIYVYSETPMSGDSVRSEALAQVQAPTAPPGFVPSGPTQQGQTVSIDVYIVSAGGRR